MNLSLGQRYMIASGLFFAVMNISMKALERIPAHQITFCRGWISLILAFAIVRKAGLAIKGKNTKLLISRGLVGTAGLFLYIYSLKLMPLASAITIQYLSPLFTLFFSALILNERASRSLWLYSILAFVGTGMVKGFDDRISLLALGVGVLSSVCSGLAYNVIRRLKENDDPRLVVLYFPLVTTPLFAPYSLSHWLRPTTWEWSLLILTGIFAQFAQFCLTKAFHLEPASRVSPFSYLNIIYAVFFGWILFSEALSPVALIGTALIILSVALASRAQRT